MRSPSSGVWGFTTRPGLPTRHTSSGCVTTPRRQSRSAASSAMPDLLVTGDDETDNPMLTPKSAARERRLLVAARARIADSSVGVSRLPAGRTAARNRTRPGGSPAAGREPRHGEARTARAHDPDPRRVRRGGRAAVATAGPKLDRTMRRISAEVTFSKVPSDEVLQDVGDLGAERRPKTLGNQMFEAPRSMGLAGWSQGSMLKRRR